jgi:hypothetical protein
MNRRVATHMTKEMLVLTKSIPDRLDPLMKRSGNAKKQHSHIQIIVIPINLDSLSPVCTFRPMYAW